MAKPRCDSDMSQDTFSHIVVAYQMMVQHKTQKFLFNAIIASEESQEVVSRIVYFKVFLLRVGDDIAIDLTNYLQERVWSDPLLQLEISG